MLKILRNNKGWAGAVPLIFSILMFSSATYAIVTRDEHIEKRYVQRCVENGGTQAACETEVASKTMDEQIEYIRDTVANPDIPNWQYLANIPNNDLHRPLGE